MVFEDHAVSETANDNPRGLGEAEIGSVSARLAELGINTPVSVCILPCNFLSARSSAELFVPPSAPTIKVLLRQAGITTDNVAPEGVKIPVRDDRDSTLILPVLFLGASYLAHDSNLLNVALSVVANYVTE